MKIAPLGRESRWGTSTSGETLRDEDEKSFVVLPGQHPGPWHLMFSEVDWKVSVLAQV